MPAPCIPCLLCEAEHPKSKPKLFWLFFYNRIWSNCKCFSKKKYRFYMGTPMGVGSAPALALHLCSLISYG
jgi:hypothetical protein